MTRSWRERCKMHAESRSSLLTARPGPVSSRAADPGCEPAAGNLAGHWKKRFRPLIRLGKGMTPVRCGIEPRSGSGALQNGICASFPRDSLGRLGCLPVQLDIDCIMVQLAIGE